MKHTLIFALMLSALACGERETPAADPAPPDPEPAPAVALDLDDPSSCEGCHAEVVREWRTSMHARAHHSEDPIYAAFRSLRIERQGAEVANQCGSCHHPRSPRDAETPLARHGVSCRSCHGVAEVRAGSGHEALVWAEGDRLLGPHDLAPDASPAHGTGPAPAHFRDGRTLCLSCHREATNPAGVPTCTTGLELEAHDAEASCTGCHMPRIDGPSGSVSRRPSHLSHAFLGPHHAWRSEEEGAFLRGAVELEARFEGDHLVVELHNRAGHGFPTGFPGRLAIVFARAVDAEGEEIWRAFGDDPRERPEVMLTKFYVDEEGEPTMAAFAARLERDSRLEPAERRTLRFELPDGARRAEVELRYFLLPPAAAARLGLAERPEASPRVIARGEASR